MANAHAMTVLVILIALQSIVPTDAVVTVLAEMAPARAIPASLARPVTFRAVLSTATDVVSAVVPLATVTTTTWVCIARMRRVVHPNATVTAPAAITLAIATKAGLANIVKLRNARMTAAAREESAIQSRAFASAWMTTTATLANSSNAPRIVRVSVLATAILAHVTAMRAISARTVTQRTALWTAALVELAFRRTQLSAPSLGVNVSSALRALDAKEKFVLACVTLIPSKETAQSLDVNALLNGPAFLVTFASVPTNARMTHMVCALKRNGSAFAKTAGPVQIAQKRLATMNAT